MNRRMAFIFDFDGTLVNSMTDFTSLAADLISNHYGWSAGRAKTEYIRTSGFPFPVQLDGLFPEHPLNHRVAGEFARVKRERYADFPFFDEVDEVLGFLRERGFLIMVSSNGEEGILRDRLSRSSLRLDEILGYRPGFLKGRDHFNYIQRRFGLSHDEMIFVGDSLNDAKLCQDCDVLFLARVGTFSQKAFEEQGIAVSCMESLLEIKARILESEPILKSRETADRDWSVRCRL